MVAWCMPEPQKGGRTVSLQDLFYRIKRNKDE